MKKIILVPIFLILLVTLVTSIQLQDHMIRYYNFTDGCTDALGNSDCSYSGSPQITSNTPDNNEGKGLIVDGNDCIIEDYTVNGANLLQNNKFTVCFWINATISGSGTFFGFGESPLIYDARDDGTNLEYYIRDTDSTARVSPNPYDATSSYPDGTWNFVCWKLETNNNLTLYVNGEKEDLKATTTSSGNWNTENEFALGCLPYSTPTGFHSGEYDELSIFSEAINRSHIIELYNGTDVGTYCDPIQNPNGCTGGGGGSPSLTLNTNLTNNTQNYNIQTINFRYSGTFTDETKDIANVSFFQQSKHNITLLNVNLSNWNVFNITLPDYYEGNYNISINASNFEVSDSTITYIYKVDLQDPMIITTDLVNNSQHIQDSLSQFEVNFTDTNLFAFNITIFYYQNSVIYNQFNQSLNGVSKILRTITKNTTTIGNYSIKLDAWDSHTGFKVKDYDLNPIYNGLGDIVGYEYDNVAIYHPSIKKFKTEKKIDRYNFLIKFDKNSYNHTIFVNMKNLQVVKNSIYPCHLLSLSENKWVDFYHTDVKSCAIDLQGDTAIVTLYFNTKINEILFNSIGDLNSLHYEYFYQVQSEESIILSDIRTTVSDILEVLNMIPLVLFYGLLMVYQHDLKKTRNYILMFAIGIVIFMFDLYFIQWLYTNHVTPNLATTWQGMFSYMFGVGLFLFAVTKLAATFLKNVPTKA